MKTQNNFFKWITVVGYLQHLFLYALVSPSVSAQEGVPTATKSPTEE